MDVRLTGELDGLTAREGILSWRCDEDIFTVGESDAREKKISIAKLPTLIKSMYPPSEEEAKWMHLDRCMRILPQDQDTGGFFVALFEAVDACDSCLTEINESDAFAAMKSLGYNPKSASSPTDKINFSEASHALRKEIQDTLSISLLPSMIRRSSDDQSSSINILTRRSASRVFFAISSLMLLLV